MQNRRIYLITLFVSLIFVALPLFCKSDISNVISGIGCSALAAAVMALFLERADAVREKKKIQQSRYIYFRQFYNQIKLYDVLQSFPVYMGARFSGAGFNE